jgi:sensor histidine kinase regulating citrate/malate metabolism
MEQQLKNAEELSKEYMQDRIQFKKKNPNMHHVAQTIAKFIRKASERETKINIDPKSQILTALRDISDKELKK